MKSKHHKAIQNYIWNRKGKAFKFSDFKKKLHGRTDYGGRRYKLFLKDKYVLKEFKKKGLVYLQKIPKSKKEDQ